MPTSPPYIAFEGAEGSGKSTQARRLAHSLDAVLTQETGGTAIGQRLRAILHDTSLDHLEPRRRGPGRGRRPCATPCRGGHPGARRRPTVVSDRSVYSSLAYQGYGRQLDLDELRRVNEWAVQGHWPTLIVYVEAPPELTAQRLDGRQLDRFELAGAAFHQRVLEGFRAMAAADPERWITVTTERSADAVAADVLAAVGERLAGFATDAT